MDRIWEWAWDRYGARYSWAIFAISLPLVLLGYVGWSLVIVTLEDSDRYVEAAVVGVIAAPVLVYGVVLPGTRRCALWSKGPSARSIGQRHWRPPTP